MPAKSFFEFFCPVKIVSGRKALSNLPYELTQLGAKKPLIVTDKGVVGANLLTKVVSAMNDANMAIGAVFEDTPVDSSDKVANQVAALYKSAGCDAFVALGGGSVIDTAKSANIVISEKIDDLLKFQGVDRIKATLKPLIVIPTTSGTGSEVTNVAVVYNVDAKVKMAFMSGKLCPNVAILDPQMTLTLPPKMTAATGMDALTHAIEAVFGLQRNPVSDAFAFAAIKLIKKNLIEAVKNGANEEARMGMADGALLAGIAFSNSMVAIVHALAHATGATAHVPHGVANSILLPYGMEYNIEKAAEQIASVAPLLTSDDLSGLDVKARARKAVEAVRTMTATLNQLCGLPLKLSQAGVKESQLETIAKVAINDGALTYTPEECTKKEALEVLKKAF